MRAGNIFLLALVGLVLLMASLSVADRVPKIVGGLQYSAAIKNDGTVWAWGDNSYGQLGDGSNNDTNVPIQVSVHTAEAIASFVCHTLLVRGGEVYACGDNLYGQLGDGTTNNANTWVKTSGIADVSHVACGSGFSLCSRIDGTAWAWGANAFGELGNGGTNDSLAPINVNVADVTAVSAGNSHAMVLVGDGTVQAWGDNLMGQLGNGTNGTTTNTPVMVQGLTDVTAVDCGGFYGVALNADGTVCAWGDNSLGQLGYGGSLGVTNLPTVIPGFSNVIDISAGMYHTIMLKDDGTVWACGLNADGELGIGTTTAFTNVPVQVVNISNIIDVECGFMHTTALQSDGTVWAWGVNRNGELGAGYTNVCESLPVRVSFTDSWEEVVTSPSVPAGSNLVAVGQDYVYMATGATSTWGRNLDLQFDWGNGDTSSWSRSTGATNGWSAKGTYSVKARARSAEDLVNISSWTSALTVTAEVDHAISTPAVPTGDTNGYVGVSYGFRSGISTCSQGHSVEYIFDWGDGSSSAWSSARSESHTWTNAGSYEVQSRARCTLDPDIMSIWSSGIEIALSSSVHTVSTPSVPNGTTNGAEGQSYSFTCGVSTCSQSHSVEYQFDWGDGSTSSWSSTAGTSHAWTNDGTFPVSARARCASTISVLSGWSSDLIVYVAGDTSPRSSCPVYRLYSYGAEESTYEHLWTTSEAEMQVVSAYPSWQYEGIAWYAFTNSGTGLTPLYRLYEATTRQHHYTVSVTEYCYLTNTSWSGEGEQYYVFATNSTSGAVPAYRFYHSGLNLHHFTISDNEFQTITNNPAWGYVYEGVGFYVYQTNSSSSARAGTRWVGLDVMESPNSSSSISCMEEMCQSAVGDMSEGDNPDDWITSPGFSLQLSGSGLIEVGGDYNGDGAEEVAYYQESTGNWYIPRNTGESSFSRLQSKIYNLIQWGGPGFVPVAGDYDGDGVDDLTVYHEQTGLWYIRFVFPHLEMDNCPLSEDEMTSGMDLQMASVRWGGPGMIPVSIDYDGDGMSDLAVCHENTGQWFVVTVGGELLLWEQDRDSPGR